MERRCETCGENLRNRVVVNEDRISLLTEPLILHIISALPTKEVVATSVLAKQWRSLWKMVPRLKFDSEDHQTFSENVYRSLLLHETPVLESFHLTVRNDRDIEIWIGVGIALSRQLPELVLRRCSEHSDFFEFPSVLFSWNDTLEILKLKYYIRLHFPTPVCLLSLRKLRIHHVDFADEASVRNVFGGCPVLEDLVVIRSSNFDVATFTIEVPSLQRLTLKDVYRLEGEAGYEIKAPSLKYLNIEGLGFKDLGFCRIENAPELVEARIKDVSDINDETILESLTSAKRLALLVSPLTIKYPPTGKIFYQLLYLELMSTDEGDWWNLLKLMLNTSPKLQVLKLIHTTQYSDYTCPADWKWNEPEHVPGCLLFHLETFVWKRYQPHREDEKGVATYILQNARRLKKAAFFTDDIPPPEKVNELATVVRASDSCQLEFKQSV